MFSLPNAASVVSCCWGIRSIQIQGTAQKFARSPPKKYVSFFMCYHQSVTISSSRRSRKED